MYILFYQYTEHLNSQTRTIQNQSKFICDSYETEVDIDNDDDEERSKSHHYGCNQSQTENFAAGID